MSFIHTHNQSVQTPGLKYAGAFEITNNQELTLEQSIGAGLTDVLVDFDFVVARLKSIIIVSDQDVTLEVNSAAGSGGTFSLLANKPLIWYTGSYYTNPFTVDATALYFSNAGAADAAVKIAALMDPTP